MFKQVFIAVSIFSLGSLAQADTYQTLRCGSEGHRYNECEARGQITSANVVNRHSNADCDRGSDWGYQGDRLWVNNGCEATFGLWIRDNGWDNERRTVHCRSEGRRYNECETWMSQVIDARVQRRYSDASCNEGTSWGVRGTRIWVNHGCEADFSVEGRR